MFGSISPVFGFGLLMHGLLVVLRVHGLDLGALFVTICSVLLVGLLLLKSQRLVVGVRQVAAAGLAVANAFGEVAT